LTGQAEHALIICDGAAVPAAFAEEAWTSRIELWSGGSAQNLYLYGENLGRTVLKSIADRS
jgi:hypothetical protein